MASHTLRGSRVLVVEDEYMLAEELRSELERLGAVALGPVAHLADALALIEAEKDIGGAILDVNLGGNTVFAAADRLIERGIPVVFTTGYDETALPGRYDHIPICEKPVDMGRIIRAIGKQTSA